MKKRLLLIITGLMLFIYPSMTLANFDYDSKKVFDVMKHLDMQGHADDDFSTCTMQQLYYEEIEEMFNEGMTKDEIIQSYVDEYGQAALREPGKDANGLVAWVMPVVAFLLGILVVAYGLKRLTSRDQIKSEEETTHKVLSETEAEILAKTFEEERRKHF